MSEYICVLWILQATWFIFRIVGRFLFDLIKLDSIRFVCLLRNLVSWQYNYVHLFSAIPSNSSQTFTLRETEIIDISNVCLLDFQ